MSYAIVFPGQGSQSIGMGKELYEAFPAAKSVFEEADDALSFHLTRLIFSGTEQELTLTQNSQPAIMTVSIAALRVLTDEMNANINPLCMAGHSLGEYTAIAAAGVLSFWDCVRLVRARGIFMQEAVPEGKGSMAALLGLDYDMAAKLCIEIASDGEISPANYNAPGQIVISGMTEYIDKAIESAKNYGAKRAVKLSVSAPFHSRYMKPAADKLRLEFDKVSWTKANYDIIANVSAKPVKMPLEIRDNLYRQTFSPVLWDKSVIYMTDEMKINSFYELGEGNVLSGLIKRCKKGLDTKSAGSPKSLEELRKCLP